MKVYCKDCKSYRIIRRWGSTDPDEYCLAEKTIHEHNYGQRLSYGKPFLKNKHNSCKDHITITPRERLILLLNPLHGVEKSPFDL